MHMSVQEHLHGYFLCFYYYVLYFALKEKCKLPPHCFNSASTLPALHLFNYKQNLASVFTEAYSTVQK